MILEMNKKDVITIKAIEKDVVNQICSGQVILSLATAVKELVENSIDAGASSVQIRLKEYGSEIIEVSDNGLGVQENNFQALTLKHYTSKISNFTDISFVETFGFRGEALSSLCTLSKMSIITKHKDTLTGTKLKFDHNGIIIDSSKIARQTGTTVILENIFYTLPVRHKEFLRNVKKEFTKMCNILYAYGVLSKGISIICTNQVSNRKMTVMETKGDTIKSNIIQIFGSKQSQHLLELKEALPGDIQDDSTSENIMKTESVKDIKLEGFVSSCVHGCGRSSSDRQFYYINSRPVDNIKVMKLVNDVYHQYNPHQYPFIVMNVKILMKFIDVNVTPDKRLIFMKNENLLLSIVKASLHNIFRTIPAVFEMQNVGLILSKEDSEAVEENRNKKTNFPTLLEKLKQFESCSSSSYDSRIKEMAIRNRNLKKHRLPDDTTTKKKISQKFEASSLNKFCALNQSKRSGKNEELNSDSKEVLCSTEYSENFKLNVFDNTHHLRKDNIFENHDFSEQNSSTEEKLLTTHKRKTFEGMKCENFQVQKETGLSDTENLSETKNLQTMKRLKKDDGISETFKKNRKTLPFTNSFSDVQKLITNYAVRRSQNKDCSNDILRFYSEINPQKNDIAEKELKKELSKESFKQMNIIGQFNLGFIITNLAADIFIIDQHASDEKYNFETLQLNTKIQTQKLVIPQNLNLTIEKEEIFLQHSDIIRKNGFDFIFDHNCDPTNRIKLISIPLSRNWVFGKEDIDELLFILENNHGQMCRPSRIRDMFASRACRKSVMIGTPLNNYEMKRIVNHMGEIEQPWNCPHGRPTIRHLINLNMIKQS